MEVRVLSTALIKSYMYREKAAQGDLSLSCLFGISFLGLGMTSNLSGVVITMELIQ